jgi:hypothetical protein
MAKKILALLLVLAAVVPRTILANSTTIQIQANHADVENTTFYIYQVAEKQNNAYQASLGYESMDLSQESKSLMESIQSCIKENRLQASFMQSADADLVLEPGLYYIQPVYKDQSIVFSALLIDPELESSLQLKYTTSYPSDPNKPIPPQGEVSKTITSKEELPNNPDIPLTGTNLYLVPMLVLAGLALIASGGILKAKS